MNEYVPNYNTDYIKWVEHQVTLLKAGQLDKLDIEMLIEELDSANFNITLEFDSNLRSVLYDLLKLEYYGKRVDIKDSTEYELWLARHGMNNEIEDSPSLIQYCKDVFDECYQFARKSVSRATGKPIEDFPEVCPWTLEQVLDQEFIPEADELVALGYVEEEEVVNEANNK